MTKNMAVDGLNGGDNEKKLIGSHFGEMRIPSFYLIGPGLTVKTRNAQQPFPLP